MNSAVDDGITFDIAAQVGALFKANGPGSPAHDLKVKRVFEAGFSQDGGFTFTQADVFNALDRMPGGGPVYDGYVPGGTTGPSNLDFGLTPAGALPAGDPRHQMQPRDVPVIQINTETEEALAGLATLGFNIANARALAEQPGYRLTAVLRGRHGTRAAAYAQWDRVEDWLAAVETTGGERLLLLSGRRDDPGTQRRLAGGQPGDGQHPRVPRLPRDRGHRPLSPRP